MIFFTTINGTLIEKASVKGLGEAKLANIRFPLLVKQVELIIISSLVLNPVRT